MIASRRGAAAAIAVALLAVCTACSGTSPSPGTSSAGTAGGSASSTSSAPAATAADACAVVPTTELAAVAGAKPDAGTPAKGKVDGGQCTWTFSKTHTAIAQLTRSADRYLPASIYPKPKDATAVDGVDRGWASAASHTIIVVKGSTGLLFNDIGFGVSGQGGQTEYDALAQAIAAKL